MVQEISVMSGGIKVAETAVVDGSGFMRLLSCVEIEPNIIPTSNQMHVYFYQYLR